MATLWIREYDKGGLDGSGRALDIAVEGDSVRDQTVTFTTSAQSASFNASTKFIAITSSVAFHYKVGANPTATTSNMRVAADQIIFIGLQDQAGLKIAAILAS